VTAPVLTPAGARFLARLVRFDGGPGYGVSLKVSPGGCSGLSSSFEVAHGAGPGEAVVDAGGVRLFLDAQARLLLDGATIDFQETPTSAGLVIRTPASGCGCGGAGASAAPALVQLA
jgi:iron-sulfur cluster assembly protein